MRYATLIAATALVWSQQASAAPVTLTFDDLVQPPFLVADVPDGYGSLQWQGFKYLDGTNPFFSPSGYDDAIVSPTQVAFNDEGLAASINGPEFDLLSVYLTSALRNDLQVRIQGFSGVTALYDETYTLSRTAPTLIELGYLGVDRVVFESFGGTPNPENPGGGTQFSVDNLTIEIVPETETAVLVVAAALGLALARRLGVVIA